MNKCLLAEFSLRGLEMLHEDDEVLFELLAQEYQRQSKTLMMVAASSAASPAVLACEGMVTSNVTTEGYPGARFHGGCEFVDRVEELAIERAKAAFAAKYANVQPHSGSSANEIVMFALLKPGDTILGLDLDCGGHLTHGSKASISGKYFHAISYGLTPEGRIDYEQVRQLAHEHRPRLIIAGASSYPRQIDFERFRTIADEIGAYLVADISHIAGLVVAGEHASPIDHAHFTTTSTYKQLYGPRGGLILIGRDFDKFLPGSKTTLAEHIQKAVFPNFQGTPHLAGIASKARALAYVADPAFKLVARRIVATAQSLAAEFAGYGYRVLTGGTDNHMVLIDVLNRGVTGVIAQQALEDCGIIVNKNRIPGDTLATAITSGMRLGTNTLAVRGMEAADMPKCAALIHRVLESLVVTSPTDYELSHAVRQEVCEEVRQLCRDFPLPGYPTERADGAGSLEPSLAAAASGGGGSQA